MFIDQVKITVKGGDGGAGCVSFRREKFIPRGGPDGGDGGKGGDVLIVVDPQMRTLLDLRYHRSYKAKKGSHGEGARKTGKGGSDVVIKVPPGTVVEDLDTGETIADLTDPSGEMVIARGGAGGKGNYAYRTSRNQAPHKSTPGFPGEERRLQLTLKLIADVGLVGLPNAGKSTLLRTVSDAKPLVAEYPFSTLTPNLAIVKIDEMASFCMVDIPGLIEGAHEGKGLGIQFLRHVERCRVLLFILDISGPVSAGEAYDQLIGEIGSYSSVLLDRPRFVALNKIDVAPEGEKSFTPSKGEDVFRISALSGEGVAPLLRVLYREVVADQAEDQEEEEGPYDPND